ncbi:MAG: tetratricopeptide repeat protein [Desulfohalobiaceae bacterium]|nr:tetratricopeptide repeat protein [Desulfohalobiaceae bacterium]
MNMRKLLHLLAVAALSLSILGCAATSPQISDQTQARIELANSHLQNGEPRRSLKELLPLRDRANDVPEYHFLLGMTYLQLEGKIQKAIDELKRATELAPQLGMAWNNLGRAYIAADRLDKAEEVLKRALSISTYLTPEYAAYNLGRLYREQKRPQEAIQYVNKALRENWRYLPAYFLLSRLYTEQGQPEQAKNILERGVEAFPDNQRLWLQYGKIQLRLGDQEQAAQSFQRVLDIAPDSDPAQVARDYLDLHGAS